MPQLIAAYKTSDGDLFFDEDDAKKHEADLEFRDWWMEHGPADGILERSDPIEASAWFSYNWKMLSHFFGDNAGPPPLVPAVFDDETPF